MATYVALSTLNARMSGWEVLTRGGDRTDVERRADEWIAAKYPDPTDLERDTLQKNLTIVSLTRARRIVGRCALNECDHYHADTY